NRVRPHEAAVFFEGSEVERDIGHGCGQDAAGRTARQVALELVTVLHAAAEFVDQLTHRNAGRRQLDARILHTARNGKAAEAFGLVTALRCRPLGAFLDNVADPEHRLDVLLECWTPEQADLRDIRRTM